MTTQGPESKTVMSLADPFLALASDVLDDTERTRIANENRFRQLIRPAGEMDADGNNSGFGLPADHRNVKRLAALVQDLCEIEHQATLNLQRLMREHPLSGWQKIQRGVGEKQFARFLATIGDPYWHAEQDRPRLVSELRSYCGHGDATRRRRKGMTQEEALAMGSPDAKMRLHLITESMLKANNREVYDKRKVNTEGRLHAIACVRCGPSGKPAQPGSPWSDAHRHADALRITGKMFLLDLWIESKRIHEGESPT